MNKFFTLLLLFLSTSLLLIFIGCDDEKNTCEYNNQTYDAGQSFPDIDGCNNCTCNDDGSVSCTQLVCIGTCSYNNERYDIGQTFPATDGCNTCTCMEDGSVACTEMYCIQESFSTFIETNYVECSHYLTESNITSCNGLIRFNCGQEVDGPLFYFDESNYSLVSTCGGACMSPTGEQVEVCQTMCPPSYWNCQ